jgi:hypothetical protein
MSTIGNKRTSVFLIVVLLFLSDYSFSQKKIKIGVWEKYDKYTLPEDCVGKNYNEINNGIDDDKNGFIDDINGIGFDENERLTTELFYTSFEEREKYNHGTSVAWMITQKNPDVEIYGVGFVPTTSRLKANYLKHSVSQRLAGFDLELKATTFFINTAIDFFKKKEVNVVNISWGLDLESFIEINNNLGHSKKEIIHNSKRWIRNFRKSFKRKIKENPNIIFVISAGNDGKECKKNNDVLATLSMPNVIIVGASIEKNKKWMESNYGKRITVYAPGVNISCKKALKANETVSGTSIATPQVTAWVATKIKEGMNVKSIKKELKKVKFL